MMSNEDVVRGFLEDCELRGLTDKSINTYRVFLRQFLEYIDYNLVDIDLEDLKKYLLYQKNVKKYKPNSILHHYGILGGLTYYMERTKLIENSPMIEFKRIYLKQFQKNPDHKPLRKLISIQEMGDLINSIIDPRDKAIVTILAKTGMRIDELLHIELGDIDWNGRIIELKNTGKRSNKTVLFDFEAEKILKRYYKTRLKMNTDSMRLFVSYQFMDKLNVRSVERKVQDYARRIGLHKDVDDVRQRFTPHCCRHWFTTWLRRGGMPRDYIKWLRGDSFKIDPMDDYNHIDVEFVRLSYDKCIPKLMI